MYTPDTYQTAISVLCLKLSYLVSWFFKSRDSVFYFPLTLLELIFKAPKVKPHWFSKADVIMRTHLPSTGPQCQGCPAWRLIPSFVHAYDA